MRTLGPQAMLFRWNCNRFSHSSWQVLKERAAKLGVHVASLGREVTEPQEPREESPPWRSLRRRKSRKVATLETTPRGEPERKAEEQPEEATTAEQAVAASSSWRCQPDTTAGTTAWEPVAAASSSEPKAAAEEVDKEPAAEGWWSRPRAEPVRGYASKAADGPFYETCQERFESMQRKLLLQSIPLTKFNVKPVDSLQSNRPTAHTLRNSLGRDGSTREW